MLTPPILIIAEGLEIDIFTSLKKAENYIEPINIYNDGLKRIMCDSKGNKIAYKKTQRNGWFFGQRMIDHVVLVPSDEKPDEEGLRQALSIFVLDVDEKETLSSFTTAELILKAIVKYGISW